MSRSLAELREYLVGEWLFQNDFRDTSGNGNHGIPTDVEWMPTERGMKPFTASDSRVTISNLSLSGISEFTVSTWIFIPKEDGETGVLFAQGIYYNKSSAFAFYAVNDSRKRLGFSVGQQYAHADNIISGEWMMLTISFKHNEFGKCYINGIFFKDLSSYATLPTSNYPISFNATTYWSVVHKSSTHDASFIYLTAFDADEVLALYESTKHAYGVQPAERSFSHDVGAVLGSPEGAVFTTDMHSKNADGTLIDLSGNSNHGTIVGCGRAGGYFRDGITCMSNTGITISDTGELEQEANTALHILCKPTELNVFNSLIGKNTFNNPNYGMYLYNGRLVYQERDPVAIAVASSADVTINKTHLFSLLRHPDKMSLWADGKLVGELEKSDLPDTTGIDFYIGRRNYTSYSFIGQINFASFDKSISSHVGLFNKLAALPLYELDCSKLPANTTEYSTGEFLPNSSIHVNSGEFQIISDAGYNQIKCVSSGSLRLLPAWEWDGDEYLTLTVDGETYSGTGTITQGTVTASISQDSTAITVNMAAGDVLDKLDIQFRRPVDE